jgi:aspartokinase/homoserine dehydrogenase 1
MLAFEKVKKILLFAHLIVPLPIVKSSPRPLRGYYNNKKDTKMKVMKFGGTSVGSVESIQRVKKIVDAMAEPAIVVVSAVGGITDKLIATTTKAVTSDTTYTTDFENICNIHNTIIDGVVPADKLNSVKEQVNVLLEEVSTILKSVEGIENISSKDMDLVVSYGERISSIIVASVLNAKHWNSLELIKTNIELCKVAFKE